MIFKAEGEEAKEKDKHGDTEGTEVHRGRNLGRKKQKTTAKPKRDDTSPPHFGGGETAVPILENRDEPRLRLKAETGGGSSSFSSTH